jgi:hypothetical protein
MDNVLEHLPETTRTMEELWRIMQFSGKLFIGVPYWNSFEAWGDPTHEKLFSEEIFEFYDPTTWRGKDRAYYSKAKFKIEEIAFCVNPLGAASRIPFSNPSSASLPPTSATSFTGWRSS